MMQVPVTKHATRHRVARCIQDLHPDTILQYDAERGRCYAAGYSDRAKGKKRKAAWIGTGVGIGAWVAVSALAASQNSSRRWR